MFVVPTKVELWGSFKHDTQKYAASARDERQQDNQTMEPERYCIINVPLRARYREPMHHWLDTYTTNSITAC
jgi:hypothetical protein